MSGREFYYAVMMYCALIDGSVSSWGRTWWYNVLVGGVAHSAHKFWLAADVRGWVHLTDDERQALRTKLGPLAEHLVTPGVIERREVAERLGLRLIIEREHDHLQPLDWKAA